MCASPGAALLPTIAPLPTQKRDIVQTELCALIIHLFAVQRWSSTLQSTCRLHTSNIAKHSLKWPEMQFKNSFRIA